MKNNQSIWSLCFLKRIKMYGWWWTLVSLNSCQYKWEFKSGYLSSMSLLLHLTWSSGNKHKYCRRFETGGSPSRRVSVLRAPAQMGRARGRARRGERRGGRRRAWERWRSRGLRVRPAPRSGALAVGGYKRPRGWGKRAAPRERLSRPRAANLF
jgi:hypothetical protein